MVSSALFFHDVLGSRDDLMQIQVTVWYTDYIYSIPQPMHAHTNLVMAVLNKNDIHFHLAAGMNVDVPSEQPSVPVYMKTMYMHCGCRDSIILSIMCLPWWHLLQ